MAGILASSVTLERSAPAPRLEKPCGRDLGDYPV
jgi:hypothetical protein